MDKRITTMQAIVAGIVTLVTIVGGSVAWATSFQTKAGAAVFTARIEKVELAQVATAVEVQGARADIARIEATTLRLEDKLDTVILRLGRR